MMSKTHEVGAICATDSIHQIWRYCEGYKAGVTYIDTQKNISTTVTVDYHNDVNFDKTFTDPEWGASTAISMIKNGADVIFGVGGRTGTGALLATAQERAYAIGVDADQYYTLPDAREYLLTSAIKLIEPGVETLIKSAKEGTFQGGSFTGEAGYAPYHDLDNQVPTGVKTEMEIILKGLQDGTIKTNVPISKPGT